MQTTNDYEQFLADVRKETGIEALVADESGLASVRVDDKYNLNLHFIEATGKILCFVEIATPPPSCLRSRARTPRPYAGSSAKTCSRESMSTTSLRRTGWSTPPSGGSTRR